MMEFDYDDEDELESASDIDQESCYVCDSCGEEIVVPIDLSQGSEQQYVEDCPVCCNPNVIFVEVEAEGHIRIWSRAEQDRM